MTSLSDLMKRAEALSQERDTLASNLHALQVDIDVIKTAYAPELKRVSRSIIKHTNELADLIKANPQLFTRPRTHVANGLKFGLQKQPGKLSWEDDAKLCARIHSLVGNGKMAPDEALTAEQEELLISVTEKPVAKALEKLNGKMLKRLGVTVGTDTDEVLIKSVDGDVEKVLNAVIKDATKDVTAEPEAV